MVHGPILPVRGSKEPFELNQPALQDRLVRLCQDSLQTLSNVSERCLPDIERGVQLIVETLVQEHRILACGNGASGALVQLFVSKLLNRFEHERPSLPAIALAADAVTLSALAQENRITESFSRPLMAIAQPGDLLLLVSASAQSENLVSAVRAAHERGCSVVALTGSHGGEVAPALRSTDVHIRIPDHRAYRVHEAQLFILHGFCALIDASLFGDPDHA